MNASKVILGLSLYYLFAKSLGEDFVTLEYGKLECIPDGEGQN